MRQTIELLKKQSIQVGLTSAHMQSMGNGKNAVNGDGSPSKKSLNGLHDAGHHNGDSNGHGNGLQRHHSTDSICSINSLSSNCSAQDKKKKKGWVSDETTLDWLIEANFAFSSSKQISFAARSPKHSRATQKFRKHRDSRVSTDRCLSQSHHCHHRRHRNCHQDFHRTMRCQTLASRRFHLRRVQCVS